MCPPPLLHTFFSQNSTQCDFQSMATTSSPIPESPDEKVENHVEKVPDIDMSLARNVATEEKDKEIEIEEEFGRRYYVYIEKEYGAAISIRDSSA